MRRRGALTARTLSLGVLGFDRFSQAPLGLPLGRLPAPDLAQAVEVLAVTLDLTLRLVLLSTTFAQANPRPWSSRTGWPAALWVNMAVAHGNNVDPKGKPGGERANVPLGRLSKPQGGTHASLYFRARTRQ